MIICRYQFFEQKFFVLPRKPSHNKTCSYIARIPATVICLYKTRESGYSIATMVWYRQLWISFKALYASQACLLHLFVYIKIMCGAGGATTAAPVIAKAISGRTIATAQQVGWVLAWTLRYKLSTAYSITNQITKLEW